MVWEDALKLADLFLGNPIKGALVAAIAVAVSLGWRWLSRHDDGKPTSIFTRAAFFASAVTAAAIGIVIVIGMADGKNRSPSKDANEAAAEVANATVSPPAATGPAAAPAVTNESAATTTTLPPAPSAEKDPHQVSDQPTMSVTPTSNASEGNIKFDYSREKRLVVGSNELQFYTAWTRAGADSVHAYADYASGLARLRGVSDFRDIGDARRLNYTSRVRTPEEGDIIVWRNKSGRYLATKIVKISNKERGDSDDRLELEYRINENGNAIFGSGGVTVYEPLPSSNSSPSGRAKFDYSDNNGRFVLGAGDGRFVTQWSKASSDSIYAYADGPGISGVALANSSFSGPIGDPSKLDFSNRTVIVSEGGIVVWRNDNGKYATVKVIKIQDDTRNEPRDTVEIEYSIK